MIEHREKRINEKLQLYWEAKCRGRKFPLESEIIPEDIADIWDSCFLVTLDDEHTHGDSATFKYTYLGQSLIDAYGDDLVNKEVCERLVYPSNGSLMHKFKEVIETKQPVLEESEFTNMNNMLIKFRSVMLPLGRTQDEVGFIIGGMKWKAF